MMKVDELRCNPFAARIVELFSEDGSGEINFQKFVNIFSVFSPRATVETKMVWAFATWDFDGKINYAHVLFQYWQIYHDLIIFGAQEDASYTTGDDLIGPRDIKRGVHLLTNADMAILNTDEDDEVTDQQNSKPRRKRRDSAAIRGEKLTEEQITEASSKEASNTLPEHCKNCHAINGNIEISVADHLVRDFH
jgi:hypothetical protein